MIDGLLLAETELSATGFLTPLQTFQTRFKSDKNVTDGLNNPSSPGDFPSRTTWQGTQFKRLNSCYKMPSKRVSSDLNAGTYFVTMTVARWYYLFDRFDRWQILADSIRYCQEHKALQLNGYVFMLNHVHLIVTSPDVAGFLRDFKRFTSKQLKQNIETHERRILSLFIDDAGQYHFWQNTNAPKKIENPAFYRQKLNYIHENPLRKNYVEKPEYWRWSSANPYSPLAVIFL